MCHEPPSTIPCLSLSECGPGVLQTPGSSRARGFPWHLGSKAFALPASHLSFGSFEAEPLHDCNQLDHLLLVTLGGIGDAKRQEKVGLEWSFFLGQWLPGAVFKAPLARNIMETELVGSPVSRMLPCICRPARIRELDPDRCPLIARGGPVYWWYPRTGHFFLGTEWAGHQPHSRLSRLFFYSGEDE